MTIVNVNMNEYYVTTTTNKLCNLKSTNIMLGLVHQFDELINIQNDGTFNDTHTQNVIIIVFKALKNIIFYIFMLQS